MRFFTTAIAALATAGLCTPASAQGAGETIETAAADIRVSTFAQGLSHPWGLAVLPDGDMLVTEREGNIRLVTREGEVSEPLSGAPGVDARDQGGMLDIELDPDFETNRYVYLSFAEEGEGGNGTAVARGRLNESRTGLEGLGLIFRQRPKEESTKHFGSRLVFDNEGRLYVTLGERSDAQFRDQAQDLDSHLGKVVRVNADGTVPDDNPFVDQDGALPEIWSYGHRNPQGAAIEPESGALWVNEHGPRGGDEINIAQAGANYGWPEVSHGVNYNGSPVGTGQASAEGFTDPIHVWDPSIGPSGMLFYDGEAIPGWQGDLFIGGLAIPQLVRLEYEGGEIVGEESLLQDLGLRIRAVEQGADGAMYLLTDQNDGAILRIEAAN